MTGAPKPATPADALLCAIEIVRQARDSICAGGYTENRQHEQSVVGPYLDGIEDELRELLKDTPQPKITDADRYRMWREMWCSDSLGDDEGPVADLSDKLGSAINEAHVDEIIDAAIREERSRNAR